MPIRPNLKLLRGSREQAVKEIEILTRAKNERHQEIRALKKARRDNPQAKHQIETKMLEVTMADTKIEAARAVLEIVDLEYETKKFWSRFKSTDEKYHRILALFNILGLVALYHQLQVTWKKVKEKLS